MIIWPNRNEINEETKSVFRDITAAENEKRLAKDEAEFSSEKSGTYEIALFAALSNRLLRTIDSVTNNHCRKMALWSLTCLKLSINVNVYRFIREKALFDGIYSDTRWRFKEERKGKNNFVIKRKARKLF